MISIEYLFNELWEVPKDKLTWHSILNKAMKKYEQEIDISDEEIKKTATGMGIASSIATAYFIEGAEWYREQLKKSK